MGGKHTSPIRQVMSVGSKPSSVQKVMSRGSKPAPCDRLWVWEANQPHPPALANIAAAEHHLRPSTSPRQGTSPAAEHSKKSCDSGKSHGARLSRSSHLGFTFGAGIGADVASVEQTPPSLEPCCYPTDCVYQLVSKS